MATIIVSPTAVAIHRCQGEVTNKTRTEQTLGGCRNEGDCQRESGVISFLHYLDFHPSILFRPPSVEFEGRLGEFGSRGRVGKGNRDVAPSSRHVHHMLSAGISPCYWTLEV